MLIEFRVENHRSIRDEQAITMEASLLEDATDPRPRTVVGHDKKLLPVAALYGANASGKTNVLAAIAFMREAVRLSHRSWAPDEGVPRAPFAWGAKRNEPSEFVVRFLIGGVRYEYGFVATDRAFIEEWLFAWPNGKGNPQKWFERDESEYHFSEHLKGENRVIQSVTRPNSLFLSAAVQNNHLQLKPIHGWILNLRIHNLSERDGRMNQRAVARIFDRDRPSSPSRSLEAAELAVGIRELLRGADIGISDFKLEHDERKIGEHLFKQSRFVFRHLAETEEVWLPFESESRGTQTLFDMALPLLEVTASGGVFVIDELEASLHPMLAAKIVQQFNDPATNPKNAQLIFTTHDTNLLGRMFDPELLRRDQVWFTEKDKEGATVIYPLTNYKPRKAENLERGYLQGRYGAVPFLGEFRLSAEDSR